MNPTRMLVNRAGQVLGPGAPALPRPIRKAGSAAKYRPSHRSLLVDVSTRRPTRTVALELGCIFLPISRPLGQSLPGLRLAVELARQRGCHLVVVCSKRARPAEFPPDLAAALGDRLILVNHARVHLDWKPHLDSSRQRLGRFHRENDAAEKRNLGLALASVIGWPSVLFMDDDIAPAASGPTLDAGGLQRALVALQDSPDLRAIGWGAKDMDDHSVVGHSRDLVRMGQDLFVGAGALLVRCDHRTPYFPNLYNHDWIFLIALAKKARNPFRAIGWAGTVQQLAYDPFIPKRARSEEAGDVIGEGLMNLLEDHGADLESRATERFWEQALLARRQLVAMLHARVGLRARRATGSARSSLHRVQRALMAAEEVNRDLVAVDLARYVGLLWQDESRWEGHLTALSRAFINRPEPRRVLANLRSGKPPAADWKCGPLPGVPAQDSIKAASLLLDLKPSARPAESDAQAASVEGGSLKRPRLRWRKGLDVRPRRPMAGSVAASQLAPEPATALPERQAAGVG